MSTPGRRRVGDHSVKLGPIKSTRIYEEIVRQVKQLIAEGRLKSGDRLPPERELAEKFVVSRTSVREALRALESLGSSRSVRARAPSSARCPSTRWSARWPS